MRSMLTIFAAVAAMTATGPMGSGEATAAPSFDCSKASSRVEILICSHPKVAQLDSDLAEAYEIALRDAPWDSANRRIRQEQKEWLTLRNRCENARCLRQFYHQRISALYAEVGHSEAGQQRPQISPEAMMAVCRDRAAHVFHIRQPNVETKYEGQRTDGSHAVNGTAYLGSVDETFQCSFSADGATITQFIVN